MPLGRGLSSLIPKREQQLLSEEEQRAPRVLSVPIHAIQPNPHQPRKHFREAELEHLVASVRTHGILQPLVVTRNGDQYELVSGERRLRAAKLAGLKTVPVIVRTAGELEKLELALIENIQREDLNPIERAHAYDKLTREFGLTQEEAARRLGKPRSVVANMIRLLHLPDEIQKAIADRRVTEGHAKILAGLNHPDAQRSLFARIVQHDLTVRETEQLVKKQGKHSSRLPKKISPELSGERRQLEERFGTKVLIQKRGARGAIIFSFASDEELRRLLRLFLR